MARRTINTIFETEGISEYVKNIDSVTESLKRMKTAFDEAASAKKELDALLEKTSSCKED
jgi:hypothetical protein